MNAIASLRGTLAWVVAFAIVLIVLGMETDWGDGISSPLPAPAASKAKPVDVALMPGYRIAGGLDARKETVERVLFNPTRRPAPPATQEAGGANSKLDKGQYVLTGTTIDGAAAAAVLKEVKSGKSHVVKKGEKIGELTVADVTQDKVRLKLGSQFEELNLTIAAGPKTTLQPATAVAHVPGQPPIANEAQRIEALRAAERSAERAAERRERRRPGQQPLQRSETPAGAAPGVTSMSEILAQRRRAAAAVTAPPQ